MIFVTVFGFTRANASFFLGSHALTGAKSTRFSHYSVYSVQPKAPGGQNVGQERLSRKLQKTGWHSHPVFFSSVFSVLCSRLRFQWLPARIVYHSRPVPVHGSAILSPLYSRSVPRPQRHLSEGSTVHHCLPADRSASEENANGLILTPALTMFSAQTSEETSRFLHDACLRGAAGAWAVRNHPFSMLSLRPF